MESYYPLAERATTVDGTADKLAAINLKEQPKVEGEEEDERSRQTRGGKGLPKDEQKKQDKEEQKRKALFSYWNNGLERKDQYQAFGLDLKKVAKRLASKYACGCAVSRNPAGFEEIVIQGDFAYDLCDFIVEEWPEISEKQIDIDEK